MTNKLILKVRNMRHKICGPDIKYTTILFDDGLGLGEDHNSTMYCKGSLSVPNHLLDEVIRQLQNAKDAIEYDCQKSVEAMPQ